jgi:predicted RNA methylase
MLEHFLQMFIDSHSSFLDPTCGSGSSLRAAEHLGAQRILGLELDIDYCEAARKALKQSRDMRDIGL